MVEVFRTNIQDQETADSIIIELQKDFPGTEVNFDLEDCDKILRIHAPTTLIPINRIVDRVRGFGFSIEILQ